MPNYMACQAIFSALKLNQGDAMKKQLFIILPLILTLAFVTCKEEQGSPASVPQEPTLALDQRLVGGRWYYSPQFDEPDESRRGYYEFTSDSKFILGYDDSEIPFDKIPVYSKDGIVYSKENNSELMRYGFHDSFPYANTAITGMTGSGRGYANLIARKGDLITCTPKIYSLYPDDTLDFWKFLIRFKEDGTPYQVYD
jgi:hypothetical protein